MDVLADMLASLRLTGAVFLDEQFREPWSVTSQITAEDCAAFFNTPHQVICYHFVRSGALSCQVGDGQPMTVSAGEIVLLPHNDFHVLHGAESTETINGRDLVQPPDERGLLRVEMGGDGAVTSMYCGYLGTRAEDDPLLRALPEMMVVPLDAVRDGWMIQSLAFAAENLGAHSPEMVGKLAEALFVEGVRRYMESLPAEETGWFAGLRDPAVGTALGLIHGRYAESWTVESLAREAGVSKTILNDRFRDLIGEAPMQYCGRWRMRVAANMLRDDRQNASSVAYSVGFSSEAAFNRAFKRQFGVPPGTWSREQRAA